MAQGYSRQGRHPGDGLFSKFGERWDAGPDDLMVEAYIEAMQRRRYRAQTQLDAAWFSTHVDEMGTGKGGTPMSIALRLPNIAVTRVENFCASGSEAFRGAVYAVASGAADIAHRSGCREAKGHRLWRASRGQSGHPERRRSCPTARPPGNFAQLASAYRAKHGVSKDDLKRAIAHVSVKSHANGAKNAKAHLQQADHRVDQAAERPHDRRAAWACSTAAACRTARPAPIVTTPEIARSLGKHDLVTVKALQLSVSNGYESQYNGWDGSHFHTARIAAGKAYREAGIERPRDQISMMEVHDCFSITELVTMEDLFISPEGQGWRDVLDGFYDADGGVPCQIDGGLKCFGHPIGASGLRMLYEMYLQLQGRAGERQLSNPVFGVTHNLGGAPASNVCSVAIIGQEGA